MILSKNMTKLFQLLLAQCLFCAIGVSYAQQRSPILISSFEGPNNSTSYGNGFSVQNAPGSSGAPIITTSQKASGSSSVQFNGRSALVLTAPNVNLGTQDFVLKLNVKPNGNQTPWSCILYGDNGAFILSNGPSKNNGNLTLTIANKNIIAGNINDDRWHSIEISRANGLFKLTVDGRETSIQASPGDKVDLTGLVIAHLSDPRYIQNWDNSFIGWLDDFQLSLGQLPSAASPPPQKPASNNFLIGLCDVSSVSKKDPPAMSCKEDDLSIRPVWATAVAIYSQDSMTFKSIAGVKGQGSSKNIVQISAISYQTIDSNTVIATVTTPTGCSMPEKFTKSGSEIYKEQLPASGNCGSNQIRAIQDSIKEGKTKAIFIKG